VRDIGTLSLGWGARFFFLSLGASIAVISAGAIPKADDWTFPLFHRPPVKTRRTLSSRLHSVP